MVSGPIMPEDPLPPPTPSTRLAPSPTGALHLGNARTFLITWAVARRRGWRLLLRIENLDTPRVKPGAAAGIIQTLRWLGIDWDDDPPVLVQSDDLAPYRTAMRSLAERALVYPCTLSRAEIEAAASAPQEGSHETPYPDSLRPALRPLDFDAPNTGDSNWRFATPRGAVAFRDEFAGAQSIDPSRTVGDFVVWTKRGQPSYQLAVVVDDHRQGVTNVIRGDDLLDSAARQLLLYRALGYSERWPGEPSYTHLPLVVGSDGLRLAKRHGDSRIDAYRARGVPAEAVIGLIASWSCPRRPGDADQPALTSTSEFKDRFDLATMSRGPVVFTPEDERWLLSHA